MADDPLNLPTAIINGVKTSSSNKIRNPILDFRHAARKTGMFKESKFIVRFMPPKSMRGSKYYDPARRRTVDLFARNIMFPGKQMSTTETNFGAHRTVAYKPLFTQSDMTFLMSQDLREREFFEEWQNSITDPVSFLNQAFYKDYVGEIHIYTFSERIEEKFLSLERLKAVLGVTPIYEILTVTSHTVLQEAWPVTVGDVSLSAESVDMFSHLSVNFAFRKYKTDYYSLDSGVFRDF